MALNQHFSNTGSSTEVAVYLERRMCIEQIRISTSIASARTPHRCISGKERKHIRNNLECMVPIPKPCPEIDFPSKTPAGSHIPPLLKSHLGGIEKLRCIKGIYLIGRIKPVQMRYMTMFVVRIISILHPLLKLSEAADLHRRQFGHSDRKAVPIRTVHVKNFRSPYYTGEYIPNNLVIHGTSGSKRVAFTHRAMFRTYRRHHYKISLIWLQVIHAEL